MPEEESPKVKQTLINYYKNLGTFTHNLRIFILIQFIFEDPDKNLIELNDPVFDYFGMSSISDFLDLSGEVFLIPEYKLIEYNGPVKFSEFRKISDLRENEILYRPHKFKPGYYYPYINIFKIRFLRDCLNIMNLDVRKVSDVLKWWDFMTVFYLNNNVKPPNMTKLEYLKKILHENSEYWQTLENYKFAFSGMKSDKRESILADIEDCQRNISKLTILNKPAKSIYLLIQLSHFMILTGIIAGSAIETICGYGPKIEFEDKPYGSKYELKKIQEVNIDWDRTSEYCFHFDTIFTPVFELTRNGNTIELIIKDYNLTTSKYFRKPIGKIYTKFRKKLGPSRKPWGSETGVREIFDSRNKRLKELIDEKRRELPLEKAFYDSINDLSEEEKFKELGRIGIDAARGYYYRRNKD